MAKNGEDKLHPSQNLCHGNIPCNQDYRDIRIECSIPEKMFPDHGQR